jgi:hypothetical protein
LGVDSVWVTSASVATPARATAIMDMSVIFRDMLGDGDGNPCATGLEAMDSGR